MRATAEGTEKKVTSKPKGLVGTQPYPLTYRKSVKLMSNPDADLANKGIEQILELSVDAHIRRRGTDKESSEFHKLTEAIATCGKALALFRELQQQEKSYAAIGACDGSPALQGVR